MREREREKGKIHRESSKNQVNSLNLGAEATSPNHNESSVRLVLFRALGLKRIASQQ